MTEEEKDAAINMAVLRLQTRIQEILFLLERDKVGKPIPQKKGGETG